MDLRDYFIVSGIFHLVVRKFNPLWATWVRTSIARHIPWSYKMCMFSFSLYLRSYPTKFHSVDSSRPISRKTIFFLLCVESFTFRLMTLFTWTCFLLTLPPLKFCWLFFSRKSRSLIPYTLIIFFHSFLLSWINTFFRILLTPGFTTPRKGTQTSSNLLSPFTVFLNICFLLETSLL